jgi:hypothetical protein
MNDTQRALKKRYTDAKRPPGVFVIRNKVNQRVYVGGSADPGAAINRHRFDLAMGTHRNRRLLHDWREHGAENFAFEVIDTVKLKDEPGFDAAAELAGLLGLWRQELPCVGDAGYNEPAKETP